MSFIESPRVGSIPTLTANYCSLTYKEKQIMEILSFVLGIASVVVIATAIVAVYAFVKVNKVKKQIEHNEISLSREIENVYKTINEETQNIYRQMDSRLDRLESKLTNKK